MQRNGSTIKVLLVEDSRAYAGLLRQGFEDLAAGQFDLTHVGRLAEALVRLQHLAFDVAVLDLSLPDSDGLETVQQVCSVAPQLPVVVLTGREDEELGLLAVKEGAQDYLVKGQADATVLARSLRYSIERKRAEQALRASEERFRLLAYSDALTGLPNRMLFLDRLHQAVALARRRGHGLAVLFMDLDRFKAVNDTLGHETGDRLLAAAAERLRGSLREMDTVARFGGDEFTVVLPEIERAADVVAVVQRILDAFGQPLSFEDQNLALDASIGISLYPIDGHDAMSLIRLADAAMYRAKRRGANEFEFSSPPKDLEPQGS